MNYTFTTLDCETHLAKTLRSLKVPVFAGPDTPEQRRDAFRAAIIDNGLENKKLKDRTGRIESYKDYFAKTYDEPLLHEVAA